MIYEHAAVQPPFCHRLCHTDRITVLGAGKLNCNTVSVCKLRVPLLTTCKLDYDEEAQARSAGTDSIIRCAARDQGLLQPVSGSVIALGINSRRFVQRAVAGTPAPEQCSWNGLHRKIVKRLTFGLNLNGNCRTCLHQKAPGPSV